MQGMEPCKLIEIAQLLSLTSFEKSEFIEAVYNAKRLHAKLSKECVQSAKAILNWQTCLGRLDMEKQAILS